MRAGWVVVGVIGLVAACGSDGGSGDVSLAEAAETVPSEGGFELSLRLGPQEGEQAAFEGGGFATTGAFAGEDVGFDGALDLAPAGADLSPSQAEAYESEVEARLVDATVFVRSPTFGEGFVFADVTALEANTVVAPVVVADESGLWQPVELLPLLAAADEVHELDRLELADGQVATRFRADVTGDLDAARAAVGLDPDGDGRASIDAFVGEDGAIVRLEADVDAGFLIANVVEDASAPARLSIDFVDDTDVSLDPPDEARDVTSALR